MLSAVPLTLRRIGDTLFSINPHPHSLALKLTKMYARKQIKKYLMKLGVIAGFIGQTNVSILHHLEQAFII